MAYYKSMAGFLGQCYPPVNCDFIRSCGIISIKLVVMMDIEIDGTVSGEFIDLRVLGIAFLTPGLMFRADFTGSKSSKKAVSREEAIAIIDEQYRCVFPFCFSMHISWRGFKLGGAVLSCENRYGALF